MKKKSVKKLLLELDQCRELLITLVKDQQKLYLLLVQIALGMNKKV